MRYFLVTAFVVAMVPNIVAADYQIYSLGLADSISTSVKWSKGDQVYIGYLDHHGRIGFTAGRQFEWNLLPDRFKTWVIPMVGLTVKPGTPSGLELKVRSETFFNAQPDTGRYRTLFVMENGLIMHRQQPVTTRLMQSFLVYDRRAKWYNPRVQGEEIILDFRSDYPAEFQVQQGDRQGTPLRVRRVVPRIHVFFGWSVGPGVLKAQVGTKRERVSWVEKVRLSDTIDVSIKRTGYRQQFLWQVEYSITR